VVCGGSEQCAPEYQISRKDFPYVGVEFVSQGEGNLVLNGKEFRLMPGAVFVYGPGVTHDIRSKTDKPMTKYFVDFAGNQAPQHFLRPGPRPGEIVQSTAPEQISKIFERLIDAGTSDSLFHERICRLMGEHLLLRIAETSVPLGTVGTAAYVTFQRCREWVESNYWQVEKLSQIAADCDVHEVHLCRLFKRYAHRGPWQYVLRLRMRDAALRLQVPNVRVRDVAEECGFNDPYQFSRTFHRVLGIRPRRFMQLQRQNENSSD
jgi:AraC-like DNA-binding protein